MDASGFAGRVVNVLVYHSIAALPGSPRFRCEPAQFLKHLRWLQATCQPVLAMSQYIQLLYRAARGPNLRRAVILTFDDGYRDFAASAYPLLRERGLPATVFIVAGSLDGKSDWPEAISPGDALLSAAEIQELAAGGVTIGAHGWAHKRLAQASPEQVLRDLSKARRLLEEVTGRQVSALAYPYGEDSPTLQAAAREAGYRVALTTQFGTNNRASEPFALHRTEIRGDDGLLSFACKARYGCSPRQLLWLLARSHRYNSLRDRAKE